MAPIFAARATGADPSRRRLHLGTGFDGRHRMRRRRAVRVIFLGLPSLCCKTDARQFFTADECAETVRRPSPLASIYRQRAGRARAQLERMAGRARERWDSHWL